MSLAGNRVSSSSVLRGNAGTGYANHRLLLPLIVGDGDGDGDVRGDVARPIGTLDGERVHPPVTIARAFGPEIQRQIASDLPIWRRVAVTQSIFWFVATDRSDLTGRLLIIVVF